MIENDEMTNDGAATNGTATDGTIIYRKAAVGAPTASKPTDNTPTSDTPTSGASANSTAVDSRAIAFTAIDGQAAVGTPTSDTKSSDTPASDKVAEGAAIDNTAAESAAIAPPVSDGNSTNDTLTGDAAGAGSSNNMAEAGMRADADVRDAWLQDMTSAQTLTLHPLCELFPKMALDEYESLKADIAKHGQRDEIVMMDGKVLDGQNRLRACIELGIEPLKIEHVGGDPGAFVLSKNLLRRHLAPGQRATIVAAVTDYMTAAAIGRPKRINKVADRPDFQNPVTRAERADAHNVPIRTLRRAEKLHQEHPDVAAMVRAGHMSLDAAAKQVYKRSEQTESVPVGVSDAAATYAWAAETAPFGSAHEGMPECPVLKRRIAQLEEQLVAEQEAHRESKQMLERVTDRVELIVSLGFESSREYAVTIDQLRQRIKGLVYELHSDDRSQNVYTY